MQPSLSTPQTFSLLALAAAAVFCAPTLAFAAFDDAQFAVGTKLSVGGIELDISGSPTAVESLTVDTSSFSFTLQQGSLLQVTAPARNVLIFNNLNGLVGNTCNSDESVLNYANTASGAITVTVTPSATLCTTPATTGGSGGGGGGGGGYSAPPYSAPGAPSPNTGPSVPAGLSLTLNLGLGTTGGGVLSLQQFLIAKHLGPAAAALKAHGGTRYFGPLTRAALAEFQKSVGITPAVGYFGPKTRAYLASLGH
ncbi:hypothetical protein HY091_03105 [Candidatus Kaiserbacteria bacterium]|nr:hypothetical protein [Candidatus Kaiserbacteria bacterium]